MAHESCLIDKKSNFDVVNFNMDCLWHSNTLIRFQLWPIVISVLAGPQPGTRILSAILMISRPFKGEVLEGFFDIYCHPCSMRRISSKVTMMYFLQYNYGLGEGVKGIEEHRDISGPSACMISLLYNHIRNPVC